VRCDDLKSGTPGCVFAEYNPTWVMNFAKTPGAVAHAWLIQSKLPNHPGSKAHDQPMVYFPASADPDGHTPDDNRKVICPDGWASKKGNPDATPLDANDKLSCDEFAYASSYNSGGMPAVEGGFNPVASGNECVQTHVTKLSSGAWRLRDDWRTSAPTWQEVCGRSAMSNWVNTQSMQPFPSTFSTPNRLLDQDEYWVAFPQFAHCDTASTQVKCTVPRP
jgi:hypothetical protein